VSGFELEPRFAGEEMIAMSRMPRIRLVLVAAALLALLVVPMAGARPVSSPSLHSVDGGWLGATLRWAADLAGLRHPGHSNGQSGRQTLPNQKETLNTTQGGGCVDPFGRPRPCY
jgi:Spy/CpxP family protein refolding chaperone